jgi:UPF0755 protein
VSGTRRRRIVVALGVVILLAGGLAGGAWLYLRSIGVLGDSDPAGRVEVVVPRGSSAADIGELLEDEGVIASALGFRITAYLEGGAENIQAGRYDLERNLTARDALAALMDGPVLDVVMVTFPEGSWLTDFARLLADETHLSRRRFLRLARSGAVRSTLQPRSVDTLEGLLWPATYEIVEHDDERSVLARLVAEFEERVATLDLSEAAALGYGPYEVVIIASMIEAEAKVPRERAKIASVIYNRLDAGMPLGIDATIAYAVGRRGGSLTNSDLAVDSPYNTRRYAGLPPTPIGASGQASLEASARPARTDLLYYVLADCDGHHAFSDSYEQFLEDKAAYQRLDC